MLANWKSGLNYFLTAKIREKNGNCFDLWFEKVQLLDPKLACCCGGNRQCVFLEELPLELKHKVFHDVTRFNNLNSLYEQNVVLYPWLPAERMKSSHTTQRYYEQGVFCLRAFCALFSVSSERISQFYQVGFMEFEFLKIIIISVIFFSFLFVCVDSAWRIKIVPSEKVE